MATQLATKVLLVDDDELVRSCLGAIIAAEGYEVATAPDAEAALMSMQNDFAPIVILDVKMPGMDGLDLCRAIRRHTYSGYVYVMLHTAKDTESDILVGLEAGADDYVSKRTPKSQLVGRLRTARRGPCARSPGRRSHARRPAVLDLARSEPMTGDTTWR